MSLTTSPSSDSSSKSRKGDTSGVSTDSRSETMSSISRNSGGSNGFMLSAIQRISLTGFPAQSVGSSNTDVLDLSCLLVLIKRLKADKMNLESQLQRASYDVWLKRDFAIFTVNPLDIVHLLVLVIGSWSRLATFQYQQSGSEMSIDNVLYLWDK
ncbi:hypothetical protein Tco_0920029 [Tanacetum coccineum]